VVVEFSGTIIVVLAGAGGLLLLMQPESSIGNATIKLANIFMAFPRGKGRHRDASMRRLCATVWNHGVSFGGGSWAQQRRFPAVAVGRRLRWSLR
jgi:hypothetical protein